MRSSPEVWVIDAHRVRVTGARAAGFRLSGRGYAPAIFYALFVRLFVPSGWWGRLRVLGSDAVPCEGAVLVVPNHDSQWDPIAVALALRRRRRLRFLARANLWKIPGLGPLLYALHQIPIERGTGDAKALEEALDALRAGEALCVFPEGKLSGGEALRARSGVARLWEWCPQARIVLAAVSGTTDYVRFPRRPRVKVEFFEPRDGQPSGSESAAELAGRLLAQVREQVPPTPAGRRRR